MDLEGLEYLHYATKDGVISAYCIFIKRSAAQSV